MTTAATAPKGLGTKARRVWREITKTYDLRLDELRILEDACREVDLIERLEDELDGEPLTVTGSMGQLVAHPLVQELRQHRSVLARLLAQLKLPDAPAEGEGGDEDEGRRRSASARDAATARWGRGS